MSAPAETHKATVQSVPESPTTARPLEMDDDDVQDSGALGGGEESSHQTRAAAAPLASEEAPPTKPPRPLTEQQKNEGILKEAFPTIDASVIKAVLTASGGRIDPAFNALLEMTDPDATTHEHDHEDIPPPQPPRPAASTPLTQLEADELLARQLAEHYENVGSYEARTTNRSHGDGRPRPREQTGLKPNELQDREHNFFEDDLPVIQEKLKQGFFETQGKVNNWFNGLKKKFDEEFINEEDGSQRQNTGPYPGRRPGESSRRSGDYERYDADPEVLSDDFAGMKFNADGTPRRDNNKALPNPDLFRPPPPSKSPKPDGRKVAFKDSTEEVDLYGSSPRLAPQDGAAAARATKASKWQPLSTVEPSPITDNDPFSLGDSEDEKEAKDKTGSKEIRMDDNERLKQAAAEAMAESLVDSKPKAEAAEGVAKKD